MQQDLLIGKNTIPSEQYLRRCIKNIANELELIEEEIENIDKSNTQQLGKLLTRRQSFVEIIEDTYKNIMKYYPETHYPHLQLQYKPIIINDEVVVSYNKEVLCINPLSDLQKNGVDTTKFIKKEVRSACRFVELMCHLSIGKATYNEVLEIYETDDGVDGYNSGFEGDDEDLPPESVIIDNEIVVNFNPLSILQQKRGEIFKLGENNIEIMNNTTCGQVNEEQVHMYAEAIIINEEVVVSFKDEILSIQPLSDLRKKGVDTSGFQDVRVKSASRFVELMCRLAIGTVTYNEIFEKYLD